MAENENGNMKLIGAFVAGGLAGAALAILLLTPAAGEEIRAKLGDLLDALKEKAGETPAPEADAVKLAADREHRNKLAEEIRRRKEYLFKKTE